MSELNELIDLIQSQFDNINYRWKKSPDYYPLNMKTKRVEDIYQDETLLNHVFSYRNFINDNIADVVEIIQTK